MSFFRVNLNKLEDPHALERRERGENSVFFALALGFFLLLALVIYWNARLSTKLNALTEVRRQMNAELEVLTRDARFVSEKDVRALDALNRGRVLWTPKLVAISALAGNHLALTRMEYKNGGLRIEGITEAAGKVSPFDRVSQFIARLQADSSFQRDFTRIEFEQSHRLVFQNQNLQEFALICHPR